MTVYGIVSGHLHRARETLLAHDSTSFLERLTIDGLVLQVDALLAAVRRLHHDIILRERKGADGNGG